MITFTNTGKAMLASMIVYTILLTILEALVIQYHVSYVSQFELNSIGQGISESDLIYHAIFIFSWYFQLFLTLDALRRRNTVQIIALTIFNILSVAYAGIQLYQHFILEDQGQNNETFLPSTQFPTAQSATSYFESKLRPIEHAVIGIISVYTVLLTGLAYKLADEFGWDNYKTYSADLKIRSAFLSLTIQQALIKIDTFFVISYAVQLIPSIQLGYANSWFETISIFVIGPLLLLVIWYATLYEQKYPMAIALCLLGLSEIYLINRLVNVNIPRSDSTDPYKFTRRFLTFFLFTLVLLIALTVYYGFVCLKNINRGIYVLTVFGNTPDTPDTPDVTATGEDDDNEQSLWRRSTLQISNPKPKKESKRASRIKEIRQSGAMSGVLLD